VVPKNGRPLDIGVPNKLGYKEFVSMAVDSSNRTTFHGFCIDVFEKALAYLPYSVTFNFHRFGNGSSTPSYDALVAKVVNKDFDAVVGDVTITTKRSLTVDFTQPYVTSGLVVVVPVKPGGPGHAWAFMRPFTPLMWCTTGVFFFFTGLVMWLLEHKKNRDFRGRPKKQVVTTLWFIFSTLFFSQSKSTLLHSASLTSLKIGQASGQTLGCKREDLHMFMTFLLNWDSVLQMEHLEALSCYLAVPWQE
jgi:ionotropic glutamate receptor